MACIISFTSARIKVRGESSHLSGVDCFLLPTKMTIASRHAIGEVTQAAEEPVSHVKSFLPDRLCG